MDSNETRTDTPEVPDWINLDAIVPPEMRDELAAIIGGLEALRLPARDVCRRAYLIHRRYDALLDEKGVPSRAYDLLSDVSGIAALIMRVTALGEMFSATAEAGDDHETRFALGIGDEA